MKLNKILIAALVLCKALNGAVWSEPEKVMSGGFPQLAVNKDGVLWCVDYPGGVYIYPDEGSDWQFETDVEFGGRICFDKGDTLWLIQKATQVRYIRYDGEAWGEQEYVPTVPYYAEGSIPWEPITADSGGGVWVGWTSWEYTVMASNRYKDGVWEGVEKLLDAEPNEYYKLLALSTDASGRVWAGWGKTEYYEPYNDYCEVAYNDGTGWSEPMYVGESEGWDVSWLTFAPDHEGGMWALWDIRRHIDGLSRVLARYWDGAEWGATDTVAENGFYPRGVVDSYGNAWVIWWQEKPTEDIDIYYSVNSGSGWSEPEPVSDDPAADNYPDIAVDGAGRIWCAWVSTRDGGGTYASYTTSVGVAEPATVTHLPSLIIDKSVVREFTFRVSSLDVRSELLIYDAGGRVVRRLIIGSSQVIRWDGADDGGHSLSCGVYFVRVESGTSAYTGKIVLVR